MINIEVRVKNGDTPDGVNRALKILKKKMNDIGILREYREKSEFKRPGEKRRLKSARARRRKIMDRYK